MMNHNFRDNKILLLGDTHDMRICYRIMGINTSNRDVVFLGDGGEGFEPFEDFSWTKDAFKAINELLVERNARVFWIRGNHSNPAIWKQGWEFSNIILVQDYDTAVFPNGKKALFVGGGVSVDRAARKVGVDYWKDEESSDFKNLPEVDVVFAHDCPEEFNLTTEGLKVGFFKKFVDVDKTLIEDCNRQRKRMSRALVECKAKEWFNGHFHNVRKEEKNGVKYQCVDINQYIEYNAQ